MAGSIRVELNSAGAAAILTSAGVAADMERRGRAIASAAGPGFEVTTGTLQYGGSPRAAAVVRAVSASAKRAQARDRVLNAAIDAGRS